MTTDKNSPPDDFGGIVPKAVNEIPSAVSDHVTHGADDQNTVHRADFFGGSMGDG